MRAMGWWWFVGRQRRRHNDRATEDRWEAAVTRHFMMDSVVLVLVVEGFVSRGKKVRTESYYVCNLMEERLWEIQSITKMGLSMTCASAYSILHD